MTPVRNAKGVVANGACSGPNCCGGNQLYTTQSTGPTYNCYYVTPNSVNTQGLQLQNAASRLRVLASPLARAIVSGLLSLRACSLLSNPPAASPQRHVQRLL